MTTPPDPNNPWSHNPGSQPDDVPPGYPPPYPPNPSDPAGGASPGAAYPGWTYPVGAYGPGGDYPGGHYRGWTPPVGAYGPPGPGEYPADLLVPHPYGGVGAWWSRLWAAFGRNWRALALIAVITSLLPALVYDVLLANVWDPPYTVVQHANGTSTLIMHWHAVWVIVVTGLAAGIVTTFVGALGSAAAVWTIVRQAAGAPAKLGAALRYGLYRFGRLGGILIVVAIMTLLGLVACVIPGLYVIVAASLVVPFAVFERGTSAIVSSFALVNRYFGSVLGRVLLTWLVGSVPAVVSLCIGGFTTIGTGGLAFNAFADLSTSSTSTSHSIGSTVISQVLSVPTTMFMIVATLATYAQMRSRDGWTTVADLSAALDR